MQGFHKPGKKKQIAHMGGLNYDSKDLKDTHVQVLGMGQKWDAGDILLY